MDIEIRPMTRQDLEILTEIDPGYNTEYVWQMDRNLDEHEIGIRFTEVRLPRSMRVEYPWPKSRLTDTWKMRDGVLVAVVEDKPVGYLSLQKDESKRVAKITDLVVLRRLRRRQIGSTLLQAAAVWMSQQRTGSLQLEVQTKNHPAISLANQLGYEFCGYSDQYFQNQDIALFFSRRV